MKKQHLKIENVECNIMSIISHNKKHIKKLQKRKKPKYLPEKIEIRIEKEIKEKIKILAEENETTVSELVRSIIYKKLREEGLR